MGLLAPLVFSCCYFCHQRLQFVLNELRNTGDILALILHEQGDEAIIGHEGSPLLILIHNEPQGSVQASFWLVAGHLNC